MMGSTFSDSEHGYQEVRLGDLVFHALDGFAGAVGISDSHGVAHPCTTSVTETCVTETCGPTRSYVAMLLRHLGTSGCLAAHAPNVRERSVDFPTGPVPATYDSEKPSLDTHGPERGMACQFSRPSD